MTIIKTRIIKIGNSQGLRIPKLVLDQLNLGEEVELEIQQHHLIIRPLSPPRRGWEAQFQAMATHGDDQLLDDDNNAIEDTSLRRPGRFTSRN